MPVVFQLTIQRYCKLRDKAKTAFLGRSEECARREELGCQKQFLERHAEHI